jgi:hypothetical protein
LVIFRHLVAQLLLCWPCTDCKFPNLAARTSSFSNNKNQFPGWHTY